MRLVLYDICDSAAVKAFTTAAAAPTSAPAPASASAPSPVGMELSTAFDLMRSTAFSVSRTELSDGHCISDSGGHLIESHKSGNGGRSSVVALHTNISPYIISIWCKHLPGLCSTLAAISVCLCEAVTAADDNRYDLAPSPCETSAVRSGPTEIPARKFSCNLYANSCFVEISNHINVLLKFAKIKINWHLSGDEINHIIYIVDYVQSLSLWNATTAGLWNYVLVLVLSAVAPSNTPAT